VIEVTKGPKFDPRPARRKETCSNSFRGWPMMARASDRV
jgi:hypothetical protein